MQSFAAGVLRMWHAKSGRRPKELGVLRSTQSGGLVPTNNLNLKLCFLRNLEIFSIYSSVFNKKYHSNNKSYNFCNRHDIPNAILYKY